MLQSEKQQRGLLNKAKRNEAKRKMSMFMPMYMSMSMSMSVPVPVPVSLSVPVPLSVSVYIIIHYVFSIFMCTFLIVCSCSFPVHKIYTLSIFM